MPILEIFTIFALGNSPAQLNFIIMKKLFYYFLYPFNRLFESCLKSVDEDKVVFLVIGYYLNDEEYDICAVCDDCNLCEDFANDLRKLDKYFRVSTVDLTLNRLYII